MTITRPTRAARRILPLAAAIPAVLSGVLAVRGGWAPTIDNGVIATRTRDVFSAHPPSLGTYTSLTVIGHAHQRLYHLGPLEFWLLALPVRLAPRASVALMLGATALNALAAGATVWVAQRIGGLRLGAVTTVGIALLAWSVGGQVLHDPWNPHLAMFPFLFVLMAAAAIVAGDVKLLPFAAFGASIVVQPYVTYAVPVALLGLWVTWGVVTGARRLDEDDSVRAARRRARNRSLVATAIVLVVCWSAPLVDELFGRHNLSGVAAAAASKYPRVGFSIGWRDLVHATSLPPVWLEPWTKIIRKDTAPSVWAIVTSILVLALLVAATAWAWKRRLRSPSHFALCGTTIVAIIGAFVTSASAPTAYLSTEFLYPRRAWWLVGTLLFITLADTAVTLAAEHAHGLTRRESSLAIATGVVAVAVALVAAAPRLGPAYDYGSAGFGAVRTISAAAAGVVPNGERWELRTQGAFASGVVGPGVASELIARGRDIAVPDANFPDLGPQRVIDPKRPPAGRILLVSGSAAGEPRDCYKLVQRWDPALAGSPYASYHQTLLAVPIVPVAVYVSAPCAARKST